MSQFFLLLSWLVASLSTFGSLYLSERLFLVPCELCWYQRICMFPLVWIIGIGAWKNEVRSVTYASALAVIGFLLAAYQLVMQEVLHFDPIGLCDHVHECSHPQFFHIWGLSLPIPSLSLVAFFLILVGLFAARNTAKDEISGI